MRKGYPLWNSLYHVRIPRSPLVTRIGILGSLNPPSTPKRCVFSEDVTVPPDGLLELEAWESPGALVLNLGHEGLGLRV